MTEEKADNMELNPNETIDQDDIEDKNQTSTDTKRFGYDKEREATGSMTPKEKSQKNFYDEQAKKEKAKKNLYKISKHCAWVFTAILTVATTVGVVLIGYYLNSISEPIGALKESVSNIEKENKSQGDSIKELRNKLNNTREDFLREN